MIKNLSKIIATCFNIGFIPFAPGTFGSIFGLLIFYFLEEYLKISDFFHIVSIIILTITSIVSCHFYSKQINSPDPKEAVIDEVIGQYLALYIAQIVNQDLIWGWQHYLISFILFRFFDITKIWPISYFDKNIKGGLGIVLDDLVAGIFSSLTFIALIKIYYIII